MNVGELSQGLYYMRQHKKKKNADKRPFPKRKSNERESRPPEDQSQISYHIYILLSNGVDFRPCCINLTQKGYIISYTWNKCSKLWVPRTLSLEHLMQGEGHFLGYPWHLQTLPFRFSGFTKAPSDYLQQAPAYLKNWLGRRKTGDAYKRFSEYRKGELYVLLHFQNNRLCQTSHSSIRGIKLIFRESLRGPKYSPYMTTYWTVAVLLRHWYWCPFI